MRYVWYRQKPGEGVGSGGGNNAAAAAAAAADAVDDDMENLDAEDANAESDLMEALVARERDRSFFYLSWDKDGHLATVDLNGSVAFTVQKKDFGRFTCEVHRIAANGKAEKFHEIDFVLEDYGKK